MSDPFDDPEFKAWADEVLTNMAPKMRDSALVMSIVPGPPSHGDVKLWVELGAALMMNKPLIVTAFDGRPVPEKLARIADEVVHVSGDTDADSAAMAAAINRVMSPGHNRAITSARPVPQPPATDRQTPDSAGRDDA